MKPLRSVFVLGIGFWMLSGTPVRAQVGGMGEALNGAGDAAKQEVMRGAAKKAGQSAPGAPAAAPAADGSAASAPAGEPPVVTPAAAEAPAAAPGSDTGAASAAVGEPKTAPGVADAPTPAPEAGGTMRDVSGVGKNMPKIP
jgi:translation initiation factor IF-2